jgi:hypothetical protein
VKDYVSVLAHLPMQGTGIPYNRLSIGHQEIAHASDTKGVKSFGSSCTSLPTTRLIRNLVTSPAAHQQTGIVERPDEKSRLSGCNAKHKKVLGFEILCKKDGIPPSFIIQAPDIEKSLWHWQRYREIGAFGLRDRLTWGPIELHQVFERAPSQESFGARYGATYESGHASTRSQCISRKEAHKGRWCLEEPETCLESSLHHVLFSLDTRTSTLIQP